MVVMSSVSPSVSAPIGAYVCVVIFTVSDVH